MAVRKCKNVFGEGNAWGVPFSELNVQGMIDVMKKDCLVQGSFCLQRKGALYVKANGESKYFEGEGNSNARWEQDLLH